MSVQYVTDLSTLPNIPQFPNRVIIIGPNGLLPDTIAGLHVQENYDFYNLFSTLSKLARHDQSITARSVNPSHTNSWWLNKDEITFLVDNNTDKALGVGRKVKKQQYKTLRILSLSETAIYQNPLLNTSAKPANPRIPQLLSRLHPGPKAIIASKAAVPNSTPIAIPVQTFQWKPKGTGTEDYFGVDVFDSSLHQCPTINFSKIQDWNEVLTVAGLIALDLVVPIHKYHCLDPTQQTQEYTVQKLTADLIPHEVVANIPIPKLLKVHEWAMISIMSEQRLTKPPYHIVYFFHQATPDVCETFILNVD